MRYLFIFLIPLAGLVGCANILGTSDFEPCSGESCEGGEDGSGAAGTSSTSSSSSSGSSNDGGDCVLLTVNVSGSVKIKLHPIEADFYGGFAGPVCVNKGPVTLDAECDGNGGNDPPVSVGWGNEVCPSEGTQCAFELTDNEVFTITTNNCP